MSGSGRSNRSCVKNIKLQVGSWDSDAARFYSEPFPLATLSGMIMNLATGRLPGLARRQPASSCSTAAAVGDANLNQSESISHTKHVGPANIQAARLSCAAACGKAQIYQQNILCECPLVTAARPPVARRGCPTTAGEDI